MTKVAEKISKVPLQQCFELQDEIRAMKKKIRLTKEKI